MQKVTVVSVAVDATKVLFGTCDCTVDSDVGMDDFSLAPGNLQVCGHAHIVVFCSLKNRIQK